MKHLPARLTFRLNGKNKEVWLDRGRINEVESDPKRLRVRVGYGYGDHYDLDPRERDRLAEWLDLATDLEVPDAVSSSQNAFS